MIPKNILIYANPRTASSNLQKLLSQDSNFLFEELFTYMKPEDTEKINMYINYCRKKARSNDNVVFKVLHTDIANNLNLDDIEKFKCMLIEENFYVIRLSRNNFKDQLFSTVIAETSKEYGVQSSKPITIDYNNFKDHFYYCYDKNAEHNNNIYGFPIHQDIKFEDVINDDVVICGKKILRDTNKITINVSANKTDKVINLFDMNAWYDELIHLQNKKYEV